MASSAWEKRNARARAEGFKNYYDKRTRRIPGAPKPTREQLRRRRGHSGFSDLNRLVKSGRVELVNVVQIGYGDPPRFDVLVILSDGTQRSYHVQGNKEVARFRATIDAQGADAPQIVGSPNALRKFTGRDDELEAEMSAAEADALELEELDGDSEVSAPDDSDIPF